MFVTSDPCVVFSGVLLLPLPTALGLQQYRATFRRNASASLVTAIIHLGLGFFAFFAFATTLGECLVEREPIPWLPILLSMILVGTVFTSIGLLNLLWWRLLRREGSEANAETGPWYRSRRDVAVGVAAIVGVAVLATYFVRETAPRLAINVSREEAPFSLPEGASDVSYCQGNRGTVAFEFTIDEEGFVDWLESGIGSFEAQAAGETIQSIAGSYTAPRFYKLAPELEGPESVTITDGLRYAWTKEDRGVYAYYDRTTRRAYYFAHYH